MQKIHTILLKAVVQALNQILTQNQYADKVIEKTLKSNGQWGARDRRFIAETTYNVIRNLKLLSYFAQQKEEIPQQEYDFCNVTMADIWHIIGTYLITQNQALPPLPEFKNIDFQKVIKKQQNQYTLPPHILHSIPEWIHQLAQHELNTQWNDLLPALNQIAPVILRANTLKTNVLELQRLLKNENIDTHTLSQSQAPHALQLQKRQNVFQSRCFKQGFFEVQDLASQMVATTLNPQPHQRIIDACAGAGGKTLHLAALMQNKGKIIALDTEAHKLAQLKIRANRASAHIIESRLIENAKNIKRLHNTADALLLDVPCSGLGVLRRNPDTKWKLEPQNLQKINALQTQILEQYPQMLKKGGKMVYATCSILPSENQQQVQLFLTKNPDFKLISQKTLYPHTHHTDGFFIALLQKNEG